MLFGVSYYHEYQPHERLDEDVRMMREAGINYARLGDSIWAFCEPADGRFEFEWLRRVLDALHEAEIKVILVTPTYAIPPWLHRKHPEIMARYGSEARAYYGGRQNFDITNPTYLRYAERVVRRLLEHYAHHPAVVGFQVDNETGTGMLQNHNVIERFRDHLKDKFGDVETVNEIWGLNYWSHRLGDWEDLWAPEGMSRHGTGASGNTNPGYDLEWRRFQSSLTTEFLAWQAEIVREYAREDQFVTQDLVGTHGRGDADRYQVSRFVDVLAENFPHATQDALSHPPPEETVIYPGTTLGSGPAQLYQRSDTAYGARGANFFVTEMNPISIGGSDNTFPGYDGQWRMAAYTCISRGADMIAYWHWHSLHYGRETYSHGILNHDLEPNRCYDEISGIGDDLARHGELLTGLEPESEVAFLYSYDSRYAFEFQPPLKTPGGTPDRRSYQRIFDACYRAFFDARAQAVVLGPDQDLDTHRILVAPALYIADDELLARLVSYAERGGHLVLTFRSGYADEYARARWRRAPGPLREAVGASYRLYSNLAVPLRLRSGMDTLDLPADALAEAWADELELEGAEPLAYYDHPHFGRYPAAVSQPYGTGRVTYLGTLPNGAFGRALASWVLRQEGVTPLGEDLPEPVRVTRSRAHTGQRLWFFSNWSMSPQTVGAMPAGGVELFDGSTLEPGDELLLGPWDIKVVVER
jgi:beta-galactosidase